MKCCRARSPNGTQCQAHARGIVVRRCGQIWPGQMRRRTNRGEHVLHEREVQHLLGGDVGDRLSPAGDGFEFLRREPFVARCLSENAANRYWHMIPCSSSAAWHSM